MSGGDSTGGGVQIDVFDCARFFESAVLNSPKPGVLAKLTAEQELQLVLLENKSLVAVTSEGEVAGSITTASLVQIKKCMDQGYKYIALVKKVEGGRCEVLLRPGAHL